MQMYVSGIGVLGPGLSSWEDIRPIMRGEVPYGGPHPTPDPSPSCLKPNELRRSSPVVRWALHVAQEAMERSQLKPQDVATVFTSSGGETDILHKICLMLLNDEVAISPTLFHHSVHNAAAGYWSISVQSQQPSSSISSYDSSFCAGLLEAGTLCYTNYLPVLLVSYDLPPPSPLFEARPLVAPFALACILSHQALPQSLCKLDIRLDCSNGEIVNKMPDINLEQLRVGNPAARSLPFLSGIAKEESHIVLDYLEDQQVDIRVSPCMP